MGKDVNANEARRDALDAYTSICNLLQKNRDGIFETDIDVVELRDKMHELRESLVVIAGDSNSSALPKFSIEPEIL